jgi:hypothetical protein
VWWVALSWGEPVVPWWRHHKHRGHPRWDGWGGPRIVNNVVVKPTTVVKVGDIRYHNATLPRAVLTVPADKFGRERIRATVENRYRQSDFAPVRGELPVKPTRMSLYGGAPRGIQPPREIVARPVVSTRKPPEPAVPWKGEGARARTQAVPESRYVIPPARRAEQPRALQRPPFGTEAGPERTPPPRPPRYDELRRAGTPAAATPRSQETAREQPRVRERETSREPAPAREQAPVPEQAIPREARPATRPAQPPLAPPPTSRPPAGTMQAPPGRTAPVPPAPAVSRGQATTREQATERRQATPAVRPAEPSVAPPPAARPSAPGAPSPRARTEAAPQGGTERPEGRERPLPGQPASQIYRGRGREGREPR